MRERQQMVFTGPWNGGERTFRVAPGQGLELETVTRIDESGRRTELLPGDLSRVDDYELSDERRLRWRSRLPSDPSFDHTELGYELAYVLTGVLVSAGDARFLLDHDFAFEGRPGAIEHFRLHLELAPEWQSERASPIDLEAGPLAPSRGFILTLPLESRGAAYPPSVWKRAFRTLKAPAPANLVLAGLFAGIVAYWLRRRLKLEQARGLFAPVPLPSDVDRAWLESHVFARKPEVIGGAYNGFIGSSNVAALLARLELEGKLRLVLPAGGAADFELELLVPRDRFLGYERDLIDCLVTTGTTASGAALRKHYAQSGFDPANSLRPPLSAEVAALLGRGDYRYRGSGSVGTLGLGVFSGAVGIMGVFFGVATDTTTLLIGMGGVVAGAGFYVLGVRLATRVHGEVVDPGPPLRRHVSWIGGWTLLAVALLLAAQPSNVAGALIFILGLFTVRTMLQASASPESASGVALRKRLAAARRFFAAELAKPKPALDDAWLPYLIALDLGPQVSRWFQSFIGSEPVATQHSVSYGSGSVGGGPGAANPGPHSWGEGGGGVGGAGGSASWVSAVSALTGGVAAPSSGSASYAGGSGGGSGGSGGGSGGGGGGGW